MRRSTNGANKMTSVLFRLSLKSLSADSKYILTATIVPFLIGILLWLVPPSVARSHPVISVCILFASWLLVWFWAFARSWTREHMTPTMVTPTMIAQMELAGVVKSKAKQAESLVEELETVWHTYHNEGGNLIRPLGAHELPDSIQLHHHKELWTFRIHYRGHIDEVKSHVPDFQSPIINAPSPFRDIEYLDLSKILKKHAHLLQTLAHSLESF
jgi:hypothetical protein